MHTILFVVVRVMIQWPCCRIATECLEKGAVVEADVIQQMKTLLPPDIADKIRTPENPATPQRSEVGPISTSTSPVVTELPKDLDLD